MTPSSRSYAAVLSALGFAPSATARAGRASIDFCQRRSSGRSGRSTGNSRQRLTIGASAMSAIVSLSSAKKDLP